MATVSTCYQVAGTSGTATNKHADGVVFLEPATMSLPTNVQEHLAELENQYKEGDLTEKGYHKRRSQLLMPYLIPYHQTTQVIRVSGVSPNFAATCAP